MKSKKKRKVKKDFMQYLSYQIMTKKNKLARRQFCFKTNSIAIILARGQKQIEKGNCDECCGRYNPAGSD